jgi:subtilisin family serine protease
MYPFLVACVLSGTLCLAQAAEGEPKAWVIIRSLPSPSPETYSYLASLTTPIAREIKEPTQVKDLLREEYGVASARVQLIFHKTNPGVNLDDELQGQTVQMPGLPSWKTNAVQTVKDPQELSATTRDVMGYQGPRTTEALHAANPDIDLTDRKSVPTAVVFPYQLNYAAYPLDSSKLIDPPAIEKKLRSDKKIVSAEVVWNFQLVPQWQLTDGDDGCRGETPTGWPYQTFDPLVLQEPDIAFSRALLAVADSGLSEAYDRFPLWFNTAGGTFGMNFMFRGATPEDDLDEPPHQYHGTHVAGLTTGRPLPAAVRTQLDRRLQLMVVKIADKPSGVNPGALIDAVKYAIDRRAAILNLSLEGGIFDSLDERISMNPAVLFVAAAGNGVPKAGLSLDLDQNPTYPASLTNKYRNLISVTAADGSGALWCTSNYGRHTVDLAAPGYKIESTVKGGSGTLSGTSQAAPLVTFTAGLLYSKGLTQPEEIKLRILSSIDFSQAFQGKTTTEGLLNINKALHIYDDALQLRDGRVLYGKLIEPQSLNIDQQVGELDVKDIRQVVFNYPSEGKTALRVSFVPPGAERKLSYRVLAAAAVDAVKFEEAGKDPVTYLAGDLADVVMRTIGNRPH